MLKPELGDPNRVSCAVSGQEDFEQVAVVPPQHIVDAPSQLLVSLGEAPDVLWQFLQLRLEVALPVVRHRGVGAGRGGVTHEQPLVYGVAQRLGDLTSRLLTDFHHLDGPESSRRARAAAWLWHRPPDRASERAGSAVE